MKVSYNLLRKLIEFDWSPDVLAERLTMSGSEVEAIETRGAEIKGVVAAKVISVDNIRGAENLSLCGVFDGDSEYQVVCGAPNVAKGQHVLFAPVDSTIPGMTLKTNVIHGHESHGMILSEAELALSDDGEGIAVLGEDIKPGTALDGIVDFKDTIYELEITPNRPDCLSHVGIAREIQAMGGGKLIFPDTSLVEFKELASKAVDIAIEDPDGCPRYTGRVIRGVKIGPSPLWLKMIVYYLGMRPINNVVDITNYVMLELGHPLHAFDYDLFANPKVVVRRAKEGQSFVTLDGTERKLNGQHLLITDGANGVAIAGIMGGEKSEVSQSTSNILLESAYFDPVTIRRGSKTLGLGTESSRRFERGADPEMAPVANDRACKMIAELAEGQILKGIVDKYPKKFVSTSIDLRPSRVGRLLGMDLEPEKMKNILSGLDITVSGGETLVAEQPSFRPDLTREVDLIEEIARIYGLDNIPSKFRPGGNLVTPESGYRQTSAKIRSYLIGRGGSEIFPLTLVDSRMIDRLGLTDMTVKLMNPLSEEMASVRPSLIVSALSVIRRNFGFKEKDLFLFEIGNYFIPEGKGKLPSQKPSLLIAISGNESPVFWGDKPRARDLFSLKGILEDLASHLGLGAVYLTPCAHFAFEQARSFEVSFGEEKVGVMGEISRDCASIADIKGTAFIAELDFEKIMASIPESIAAVDLARFPSADRDIAIVVEDSLKSEDIRSAIVETGGKLVDDVWIFDLYKGKNIPQGKKSLAFGIKYRLPDRTLTDNEVDEVHSRIAETLKTKFGAELRS